MAEPRDIVCRCGNYLGSTRNTSGGGSKVCSACRRRVRYTITKNGIYTAYEK